ncbi:MAG: hypothetical protein GT596_11505 [Bacteroidales bacterium]|nr:hypothetical protein [Bacteroidales bacterium]
MANLKGFTKLDSTNAYILERQHGGVGYSCKADKTAIECLKCGNGYIVGTCSNCGGNEYESGLSQNGQVGLFCKRCNKGFTSITCQNCGTENPINQHTFRTKGCYIVTATAGYNSRELDFFYYFRDNYLDGNKIGEKFIKFYYSFSPQLANIISKSKILKSFSYKVIVKPCYYFLKMILRK